MDDENKLRVKDMILGHLAKLDVKDLTLIQYCYVYRDQIFVRVLRGGGYENVALVECTFKEFMACLVRWESESRWPSFGTVTNRKTESSS